MKETTIKRLQKANEAVRAAETLLEAGHEDFAAGFPEDATGQMRTSLNVMAADER